MIFATPSPLLSRLLSCGRNLLALVTLVCLSSDINAFLSLIHRDANFSISDCHSPRLLSRCECISRTTVEIEQTIFYCLTRSCDELKVLEPGDDHLISLVS